MEQPSPPVINQLPVLCEECKINSSKYKCPGCSTRSCSLVCVNSHKKRTACTGKRPLTSFVSISQFDDNLLISDYNMLEDVKRLAESAQRVRMTLCGYSNFKLPFPLKNLRNAAKSRRMNLLFHPKGMSKRQKNKTYYDCRRKFIYWTIEWRFHSTDVVLIDHRIHESTTLSSVIESHLKPGPWNHPLRKFSDESLDSLNFFIEKYPKGSKAPFFQLNIHAPIRTELANTVILEYPVIHVYLPSHTYDFVVIKRVAPSKPEKTENPTALEDSPTRKGVTFKEEEIEGVDLSDPRLSDLTSGDDKTWGAKKECGELEWIPRVDAIEDVRNAEGKSCIEQLDEIGDFYFDLDFDPDMNGMGPEAMGKDLGRVFCFDGNGDGMRDSGCDREFLLNTRELEEGEIP